MNSIFKKACYGLLFLVTMQASAQDIMTAGGTITVSKDNSGGATAGEGSLKLVDNNPSSKLFVGGITAALPWYMQWECTTPATARQYRLVSGGDAQNRDPKNWQLLGSNDASNWTILDTRSNEVFPLRTQSRGFDIATPGQYKYYRFVMSANAGSGDFQLAEWRLSEGVAPAAPTDLVGTATGADEISLRWSDNANNETAYIVEMSTNGVNFTTAATLADNQTAYVAKGLAQNKEYYFRIKASNVIGATSSNTTSVTTLNFSGMLFDITDDGGKLVVSNENTGGPTAAEGSPKLIDNNVGTKYLIFGSVPAAGFWIRYKPQNPYIVTKYTFTTGNDASGRDPKTWKFQGSNDSTTWVDLDTRTNVTFPARSTPYTFYFNNSTEYSYFRLLVTQNNGEANIMFQMQELEIWGLSKTAPKVPDSLDVTAVTFTTATLKWKDVAENETGFEVERSDNGIAWESAGQADANATTYVVPNLLGGFKYYFRVRAINASTKSIWSTIVDTITDYDPKLPLTPRNLKGTALSQTEIALTWDDNSNNETSFEVERSTNGINFIPLATTGVDVNQYNHTGLTVATRYYYRVKAVNSFGSSYYSNVLSVITQGQNVQPTLDAISNIRVCTNDSTYKIELTGITPGPEAWQTVGLAVTTNNQIFDELAVTPVADGKATLSFNGKQGGTATITVTAFDNGATFNGGKDSYTRTFTITIDPLLVTIASEKGKLINRYETAVLVAGGADTYVWNDAHGILAGKQSDKLLIRPDINTAYIVTGTNSEGCKDTDTITIRLKGDYNIEAVNVITPNNDGKNDRWVIWNINAYPGNEVTVLDRAGRTVFYQKQYMNTWDGTYNGKPLPEGAYLYMIKLGAGIPPVKGILNIIRNTK